VNYAPSDGPSGQASPPVPAATAGPVPLKAVPSGPRLSEKLRLRWFESWIIRAAIIATMILFLGYASSAFFALESIEGVARLAHDQSIEDTLGAYQDSLKRVHALEQDLLLARLRDYLAEWQLHSPEHPPTASDLLRWAGQQNLTTMGEIKDLRIVPASGLEPAGKQGPAWIDKERLRLGDLLLEFPKGPVYENFQAVGALRQRYQLVGVKLDSEIRPTLIRATTTILIVSFLLLLSIFILYARRFRTRILEVTEGFIVWSERDSSFRFHDDYSGELRLITVQFNAMAGEVEANRQRSLYLEKIASWQIIARKLAHEIKNPLTPIQMMVSQLKRRYKGDDPAFAKILDEAQVIITEEVAGLRRMVDNFSEFARLPEPDPHVRDIVPLCRHVLELQRNVYEQHQFYFESALAHCYCLIDEDLIRQVLINLIKNAAEACADAPTDIAVLVEEQHHNVLIKVRDHGPGIPPELTARIFEAYFTTKHTGPNPGMGLGLAVCQKIILDHGGRLSVISKPGETIFTIQLPRRTNEPT